MAENDCFVFVLADRYNVINVYVCVLPRVKEFNTGWLLSPILMCPNTKKWLTNRPPLSHPQKSRFPRKQDKQNLHIYLRVIYNYTIAKVNQNMRLERCKKKNY